MTLSEIKGAVNAGQRVFWKHEGYEVLKCTLRSGGEQWLIKCHHNGHCIGLTWQDGVTMNGKPEDFFTV